MDNQKTQTNEKIAIISPETCVALPMTEKTPIDKKELIRKTGKVVGRFVKSGLESVECKTAVGTFIKGGIIGVIEGASDNPNT